MKVMTKQEIKQIRKWLGWSQEQLARELGLSFSTISRWERGVSSPSPAAERLLNALTKSLLPAAKPVSRVWLTADQIDISGIVGIFTGPKDLSVRHDLYLTGSKQHQ
jgi:transcriptional regulator with XRE-family HTH domain